MMKSLLALGVLAAPLSAQTSVTIYNDGRVLVRRELAGAPPVYHGFGWQKPPTPDTVARHCSIVK